MPFAHDDSMPEQSIDDPAELRRRIRFLVHRVSGAQAELAKGLESRDWQQLRHSAQVALAELREAMTQGVEKTKAPSRSPGRE